MRNRKARYGEQKLLELIDKEMQSKSNLDYSQIKDQITIEEKKGIEKVENNKNLFIVKLKYALSIILLIVSIVTYCTICTLNNEGIFENNNQLTEILIEEFENKELVKKNSMYYYNTSLLSIITDQDKNNQYVELSISKKINSKYYCAYLDKKIIKKVNEFFNNNDISKSEDFIDLYHKSLFLGIDLILLKSYFYFNNTDIDDLSKHLKWIEYDNDLSISYEINNYQLVYLSTINKANNLFNISNNIKYNKDISVYHELDFTVKDNLIIINENECKDHIVFLCMLEDIENMKNISIKYLYSYCSEVVNIKDKQGVYINTPQWYGIYNDYVNNSQVEIIYDNSVKFSNILSQLQDYLVYKDYYKRVDDLYLERYYYYYDNIKLFLLSQ